MNTTPGRRVPAWHSQYSVGLPHRLIIVRRDQAAILAAILSDADRWPPGSAVMLDRRTRERRGQVRPVSTDRRRSERRTPPDTTWQTQGFTVVHAEKLPSEAILLDDLPAMSGSALPEPVNKNETGGA